MTITERSAPSVAARHRHAGDRDRRPHQGVPGRHPGRRPPRPRRRARRDLRPARPERRRQDDHRRDAHHPGGPDLGHGARRRHRRGRRTRPRPSASSASCPRPTRSTGRSTVWENLYFHGRFFGMDAKTAKSEATRLLEQFRLDRAGRRAGDGALGRHGAAADGRPGGDAPAVGAVPRRADRRPRPAEPHRPVGDPRRAPRRRPDDPAHHALHGGGRPALRPGGHHRPGPHRRPRHAGRASSARSAPTPPCASSPTATSTRSATLLRAEIAGATDATVVGGAVLLGVHGAERRAAAPSCRSPSATASTSPTCRSPRPRLETVFINLTGKDLRE